VALRDLFRRIVRPAPTPPAPPDTRKSEREFATAWLEAQEAGELQPPGNVHDAGAWDTYWNNQLRAGPIEQACSDMMSSDDQLVGLMTRREARTVLCAGSGAPCSSSQRKGEPALDRLAARLAERGMFVSQVHDSGAGPDDCRRHHAEAWAKTRGFLIAYEVDAAPPGPAPRLAWLSTTTG